MSLGVEVAGRCEVCVPAAVEEAAEGFGAFVPTVWVVVAPHPPPSRRGAPPPRLGAILEGPQLVAPLGVLQL